MDALVSDSHRTSEPDSHLKGGASEPTAASASPARTPLKARPPPLSLADLGWLGQGLSRPECVLATAGGSLYTADWRGGVTQLKGDGSQVLFAGRLPGGEELRPNGIALLPDGSFLVAHLGAEQGGVYRLWRDGRTEPWLLSVGGQPLPPTNFVLPDHHGRVWVTVSTRRRPRSLAYRAAGGDGFIVCVLAGELCADGAGGAHLGLADDHARIVADHLGYTNEVAIDPSGKWLYVNETFARCLSRFQLRSNGDLGPREVVTYFGAGCFPDGLAFDEEGCAWVVSIVSNRLIRVAPDGQATVWLEDADSQHLAWVESAYRADQMDRPHLDGVRSQCLLNISSIAFAGADRRTGVLGCLLGGRLATLPMPAPGVEPFHWNTP
jgi:sugar lactone lactonase YvrE